MGPAAGRDRARALQRVRRSGGGGHV